MGTIRKIATAAVLIAALLLLVRFLPVAELLHQSTEWIDSFGPAALVVYAAIYIAATLACIPVLPLTIGAGALFGWAAGSATVVISTTTASAIAFLIGRYLAREQVERIARRSRRFDAIDKAVGIEGWRIVVLLRLVLLVPFGVSNYVYGITAIRFWPYLLASLGAMLPGTVMYCFVGQIGKAELLRLAGLESLEGLNVAIIAAAILIKIVVVYVITRVVRRHLKVDAGYDVKNAPIGIGSALSSPG